MNTWFDNATTVEFLVWNIVGTGLRAIPYDRYSTINKMNIKYKIS
jgi:hypothetical protein